MQIGIDGHVLGKNIGGVERFVRELVAHLPTKAPENHYIVFVTKQEYAAITKDSSNHIEGVEYVAMPVSNPLIQRLILLPLMVKKYRLDALLVQRLSPWFCGRCKLIATIHDLTPLKFAENYKGLSNTLVRLLTKNTIQRADLILTPTKSVKTEIEEYCPKASAPVVAFYNGVDTGAFSQSKQLAPPSLPKSQPYLLTVGAIEQRKNLETIFKALSIINDDIELAVVGSIRDQEYSAFLKEQLQELGLEKRVHFIGFIDEEELISLYKHAAIFISASRDEGFNIPVLEAMACGTPTVCSNIDVHKELFCDAAVFYEVESAQDLSDKMNSILDESLSVKAITEQGLEKIKQYTWEQTATNVAAALRSIS